MKPYVIVLIVCASVVFLLLTLSFAAYFKTFYQNPRKKRVDPYRNIKDDGKPSSLLSRKLIDEILALPYEDIYTASHDGHKLRARLYMKGEDLPFVIQAHGYRSTPMLDFSGGGAMAMELNFNVIMIDQRAHGESGGRSISFGYLESRDLLAWIRYVADNYGSERKIILQGISMGAASVLIASGYKLPPSVKGILADCPYSRAKDIIKKVISSMGLPKNITYPFVRLGGFLFGGFDINLADPAEAVKRAKVPILIIHGEADNFVPCDMSREIAECNPSIELHTFPEAKHGLSFIQDNERYRAIAAEFCLRCISGEKKAENGVNNERK